MKIEKEMLFIIGFILIISAIILLKDYSFFMAGIGVVLIGFALLLLINEKDKK